MELWQAVILGIVEGLTEFLPVSSTGHLTIAEKLLGLPVDDPAVTGYTAVIQIGAILAVLVYFAARPVADRGRVGARPVRRTGTAARRGLPVRLADHPRLRADRGRRARRAVTDRGAAAQPLGGGQPRLLGWSVVMWWAERNPSQKRGEGDLTARDMLIIGVAQCFALIPGVSRSGATISAGLLRGVDRVTATRLSFFLGIPALVGAGLFELPEALNVSIGLLPVVVGTVVSFVVAYASVAWLLRFVSTNRITAFVPYRVGLAVLLMVALGFGWISAT